MSGPGYHGWTHAPKEDGGTDPIPGLAGPTRPWIMLYSGGQTIPTDTLTPIIFTELVYDPALVTQGVDYDWEITAGGVGDRFAVKMKKEGAYLYDMMTQWDQVSTDGANDHGYAMHDLNPLNSIETGPAGILSQWEITKEARGWPKNDTTGEHEMLGQDGFLRSCGLLFVSGNAWCRPRAYQTTGSDRGLSGNELKLWYLGPLGSSGDWTYVSVP